MTIKVIKQVVNKTSSNDQDNLIQTLQQPSDFGYHIKLKHNNL